MKDESPPKTEMPSPVWERAARNLAKRVTEPRGSMEIYLPTHNVCVTRATGHLSVEYARLIPEVLAPYFAQKRTFSVLNHWGAMTTYDSGARRLLTNWVLANRGTLDALDVMVTSRIVAMGVAVANVATSLAGVQVVAYTDRAEFERAMSRHV